MPKPSFPHSFETPQPNLPAPAHAYITDIADIFRDNLRRDGTECPSCIVPDAAHAGHLTVRFALLQPDAVSQHIDWSTDESYTLDMHTVDDQPGRTGAATMGNLAVGPSVLVHLNASSVFGLRHGLETLAQLVAHSTDSDARTSTTVILNAAKIGDRPAYAHRGLLLDTARNPLTVADLERTVRGMAATKLNVLHWHATDTQSFSLDLPGVPAMARNGAYSARSAFSAADVRRIVRFALLRGVRVLIEIDAPSHAGNGWQWGVTEGLGNLTVCKDWQPWRQYCVQPPCGQLNPVNEHVYAVLRRIYEDVRRLLPDGERVLHMGGDEVWFGCWNATGEVVEHMAARGWGRDTADFVRLWSEFQGRALSTWTDVVRDGAAAAAVAAEPVKPKAILWSSHLTDPATIAQFLPQDRYVVQTWVPRTDDMPQRLLAQGYELIVSTKDAWYFDHGFWGQTAYYTWARAYDNRILRERGVLGGEACVWSELIDGQTLDGRVWPRAAAVAERLWSNPTTTARQALVRMYRMRERLVRAGLAAEAVAPVWCVQNEGQCL